MDIIPGIFEKDQNELERKIDSVFAFVHWIHIDVSDTVLDSTKVQSFFSFFKKYKDHFFEAHLSVPKPETYVKHLVGSGFARVVASVECHDPREFLGEVRAFECEAGLSIDVETPLEAVEPFLEELDFVVVLSSQGGTPAGLFEERSLEVIKAIHRNLPDLPIEAEGGINEETIKPVVDAGATRIVSSSYIFRDEKHISDAIQNLSSIVTE